MAGEWDSLKNWATVVPLVIAALGFVWGVYQYFQGQADILSEPGTKRSLAVTVDLTNDGTPGTKLGLNYGDP